MPLLVHDTTMTIDKELTMKIHWFIIQTLFLLGLWLGFALQSQAQTGTVTYIYTDPQGTPLAEADINGNITATFDYTPYGSQALGTAPSGPGYTGHVNDQDTGLVYMQARYYDPATGRFLSVDPSGPAAGNAFNFSRYAYANNNPATNIDPNGKNATKSYNVDGSISIQLPITFSGPGASQSNISAIKSDIANHWSGLYSVAGQITKVSVAITDVNSNTPKTAINNITLVNGPTSDKAAQGASFVAPDSVSGEWNMMSNGMKDGEAAHEAGHLMGDTDYYASGTDANGSRVTTAQAGYGNNLMGALGPTVIPDSRNMNVILNSPINVTQNPPPPKTNP